MFQLPSLITYAPGSHSTLLKFILLAILWGQGRKLTKTCKPETTEREILERTHIFQWRVTPSPGQVSKCCDSNQTCQEALALQGRERALQPVSTIVVCSSFPQVPRILCAESFCWEPQISMQPCVPRNLFLSSSVMTLPHSMAFAQWPAFCTPQSTNQPSGPQTVLTHCCLRSCHSHNSNRDQVADSIRAYTQGLLLALK